MSEAEQPSKDVEFTSISYDSYVRMYLGSFHVIVYLFALYGVSSCMGII